MQSDQVIDICWQLDFDEFTQIVRASKNTSPGPDGVPYSYWAKAPLEIIRVLFNLFIHLLNGGSLPVGFTDSFMVFIHKKVQKQDYIKLVRSAGDTRTLSLSNTDEKIIAKSLCTLLVRSLHRTVSPAQFGLRGTSIVDIYLQIESSSLITAAVSDNGAVGCFDKKNAFPSLKRKYLWYLLKRLKVPPNIIALLKLLFLGCKHYVYPNYYSGLFILFGKV